MGHAGRRTVVLSSTFENSFFDKNTVNTRNVTHYCVIVAELLSTVFIIPCFCEFLMLHEAMSHAYLSVSPGFTAVLESPMILNTT